MIRQKRLLARLVMLAALASAALTLLAAPGAAGPVSEPASLSYTSTRPPLHFIENRGQVDPQVRYYARGRGWATYFTREGLTLALAPSPGQSGAVVRSLPWGCSPA